MKPQLSFQAQYGSENYRLNRPDSDVDMMFFYNPNYEDLFNGRMATDSIKEANTDRKHHDVRKMPSLFYKANVNFLEILYSCNVKTEDDLYSALLKERDAITTMNIPHLFDGCLGMFNRNYGLLERDAHYVTREDLFDSNTHRKKLGKHSGGAYRILDFVQRFADLGFTRFGQAMSYDHDASKDQALIQTYMAMRDGRYSYEELKNILKQKEADIVTLKPYYKEQAVKEDVNHLVMETVQAHVKRCIQLELSVKEYMEATELFGK